MTKLRPKREHFCREYVIDHNAKQAAIRSGYSVKTATAAGSALLTYPEVKARIAELEKPALAKLEITAERVLSQLAGIAFDHDPHGKRVRHFDQIEANKLLGKHLKMFTDKLELSGQLDVNIADRLAKLRAEVEKRS